MAARTEGTLGAALLLLESANSVASADTSDAIDSAGADRLVSLLGRLEAQVALLSKDLLPVAKAVPSSAVPGQSKVAFSEVNGDSDANEDGEFDDELGDDDAVAALPAAAPARRETGSANVMNGLMEGLRRMSTFGAPVGGEG